MKRCTVEHLTLITR